MSVRLNGTLRNGMAITYRGSVLVLEHDGAGRFGARTLLKALMAY